MIKRLRLVALSVTVLSAGCATYDPEAGRISKFGPQAVMQQPVDEPDLVSLITQGTESHKLGLAEDAEKFSVALDNALRKFYSTPGSQDDLRVRRNRIQDRLILASNAGCEAFKTVLKRKQSERNFEFGSATVLFGAAGAVANGAQAAKNLAALAGLSGGVRAEYNRDFFADATAHVITKGINARRKELMTGISAGQTKDIKEYSLEGALADIVVYHGACSLIGGLEYAEGALSTVKDDFKLGLDSLKAISPPKQ